MTSERHGPEDDPLDRPLLTDRRRRLAWLCLPLVLGGEILVSQAVADQLDGRLRLSPWKTVELRGATGTYQLYELDPDQPV